MYSNKIMLLCSYYRTLYTFLDLHIFHPLSLHQKMQISPSIHPSSACTRFQIHRPFIDSSIHPSMTPPASSHSSSLSQCCARRRWVSRATPCRRECVILCTILLLDLMLWCFSTLQSRHNFALLSLSWRTDYLFRSLQNQDVFRSDSLGHFILITSFIGVN